MFTERPFLSVLLDWTEVTMYFLFGGLILSYAFYYKIKKQIREKLITLSHNYKVAEFLVFAILIFFLSIDADTFSAYNKLPQHPYKYDWYSINDIMRFPIDNINIMEGQIRSSSLFIPQKNNFNSISFFNNVSNALGEEKKVPQKVNFIIVTDKTLSANSSFNNEIVRERIAKRISKLHPFGNNKSQQGHHFLNLDVSDMYNMELLYYLYMLDPNELDVSYQFVYYTGNSDYSPMIINKNGYGMPSVKSLSLPEAERNFCENISSISARESNRNIKTHINQLIRATIDGAWYNENAVNKVILMSDFIPDDDSSGNYLSSSDQDQYDLLNKAQEISIVRLDAKNKLSLQTDWILKDFQLRLNQPLKEFFAERDSLPRRWISPLENNTTEAIFVFYPFTDIVNREIAKGTFIFNGEKSVEREIMFCKGDNTVSPANIDCRLSINYSTTLFLNCPYRISPETDTLNLSLYADNFDQLDHNYFLHISWAGPTGLHSKRYPLHVVVLPSRSTCEILNLIYFTLLALIFTNFIGYAISFWKKNKFKIHIKWQRYIFSVILINVISMSLIALFPYFLAPSFGNHEVFWYLLFIKGGIMGVLILRLIYDLRANVYSTFTAASI